MISPNAYIIIIATINNNDGLRMIHPLLGTKRCLFRNTIKASILPNGMYWNIVMPMESYRRRLMIVTIPSTRIIDVPVHTSLYRIVPPVRIYKIRLPINISYTSVPMGPGLTFVIAVDGRVRGLTSNMPSINHPVREGHSIMSIHPSCRLATATVILAAAAVLVRLHHHHTQ